MPDPVIVSERELRKGTPRGSLDGEKTDLLAGEIRAFTPEGFQGLLLPEKASRRILCIPFGTQVPPEKLDGLRELKMDGIDKLLDLFRELGHTLPIFRPDPGRFQAQNGLLAVHRVGYNRSEGIFVLV